jgi:hypothetical protein
MLAVSSLSESVGFSAGFTRYTVRVALYQKISCRVATPCLFTGTFQRRWEAEPGLVGKPPGKPTGKRLTVIFS